MTVELGCELWIREEREASLGRYLRECAKTVRQPRFDIAVGAACSGLRDPQKTQKRRRGAPDCGPRCRSRALPRFDAQIHAVYRLQRAFHKLRAAGGATEARSITA